MKTIPTNLLRPAFEQVLARLAAKHDLPELTLAEIVESEEPNKNLFEVETKASPRGQMTAFINDLEVTVSLNRWDDSAKTFGVQLRLSYKHIGGGSNGYNINFMMAVEQRFGRDSKAEVTALVERSEFHALQLSLGLR